MEDDEEEDDGGGPDGSGSGGGWGPPFRGGVVTMPEPGVCGVAGRMGVHGPIPTCNGKATACEKPKNRHRSPPFPTFKFMFPPCISSLVFGRSMLLTASLICDKGPPDSSSGYWPLTIPEKRRRRV